MEALENSGLRAKLARPSQPSRAGVLVLPHWPGVDEFTEEICERLADEGFAALAWDPFSAYDPGISPEERRRLTRGVITDEDARREQMHWVGYMRQELGLTHVAGIGFCMGGRQALLLGVTDRRPSCVAAFYPTIRLPVPEGALDSIAAAPEILCPVQIHYPGKDEVTTNETFAALRSGLEQRPGLPTFAHHYPEADHGFMNHERTGSGNESARVLSWPLAIAFLNALTTWERTDT